MEYWRVNDPMPAPGSSRSHPTPGRRVSAEEVSRLDLGRLGVASPVHVVVADANDRSQAAGIACHVRSGRFPAGAFVRIEEGLYVESPEEAFLRVATELTLAALVRFGLLLCGTYVHNREGNGFRKRKGGPLTTVEALRRRVEKARGERGFNKAARALRFVANGSASPMETILCMALCLPRMLGGYGFELPRLNYWIDAGPARGLLGRDHFECDLYWPRCKTAIEYDSREFHEGTVAETRDSARRSGLLIRDVLVITVTRDQFFDARKLDEAARALAKRMGKRLPANDAGWMMKRHRLRAELIEDLSRGRG
ncbi:hypothetical protein [Arabiibacter massiliensis]|uniref:hypothetical protein n=1 Tax=Arabiibacter massiliensis TaxID=1870985 RepID=UPI001E29AECE|nr:hypothetical protein [Arabiibacter massiliensis]